VAIALWWACYRSLGVIVGSDGALVTTRAIGYVRVSTDEQATSGVSLDAQRAKIEAWCALHDVELLAIESDAGISGKSLNRPALVRALESIRRGDATVLIVADLSRLTRRTRDLLDIVDRHFRSGERSLVSIRESIDTTTPAGRMIVTVLGALNELEREQISIRTASALGHLKSQGRRVSGAIPYGQALATDGETLVPHEGERAVIEVARGLRARGLSLRAVSDTLASRGLVSRAGRAFAASAIAAMTA
jgi:site-specific DNA recombinase